MKNLRYLVVALIMISPYTSAKSNESSKPAESVRLASFDTTTPDLNWQIVNDTVMGGRSSSRFNISAGQLRFSGTLNTNGGGFASVRSGRQDWQLDGYAVFRLKVRGDGRRYRLRLFTDNDSVAYQHEFITSAGQWQVVELPLQDFYASWRGRRLQRPPMRAEDVAGIGFIVADGVDGPFSLAVDWIEADVLT